MSGLLLAWATSHSPLAAGAPFAEPEPLPRFTEEREAAVQFFVRKHLPELLALLEQLKKNNGVQYERQIREIFQVTELLAELRDEPRRHELELRIWVSENKAHTLVARLSTTNEVERKKLEGQLAALTKELVNLDVQVLELKVEQLDKELAEVKDELSRARQSVEKRAKERYEELLSKAKKPNKV
jgi:hypothetical protein